MAISMTQAQALNWAHSIYKKGGTAYQNPYGKQCMALAVHYCVTLSGFRPWGNAIAFASMALPADYTRIKNVASTRPRKGDLVVWAYGSYSTYGHVGIVTDPDPDGNLMTFVSLDQNWYNASLTVGSPPSYVKHNYSGVWGFIRPKFATAKKATQATNKAQQKVSQATKKVGSLEVGKVPPSKYTWSKTRLFKAKADSEGVTINARSGGKGNYSWNNTNTTYPAGTVFWVYEVLNGWCRIYNNSYNGWVWHERLRITSIDVKPSNKGSAKKAPAKKAPVKKAPAKKAPAKKTTTKKETDALDNLKTIKSKHITGTPIKWQGKVLDKKPKVEGVILHNDYGTMKPSQYVQWLYNRETDGSYTDGWAAYYINRNEVLYYNPDNYVEWHAGNAHANSHLVGIEITESHPAANLTKKEFLDNEEMACVLAAKVLKKYKLPVNRTTVQLHRNWSATSCPHKSWDLHVNGSDTKANRNKLQDYFIKRIKHYYDGGKAPKTVAPAKDDTKKDNVPSIPTGYVKNSKGVLTKREKARFIVGDSPIKVRTGASTKHRVTGILPAGYNGIIYDTAIIANGYRWISYISDNGRRYMATGRADKNGNRIDSWGKFTTV